MSWFKEAITDEDGAQEVILLGVCLGVVCIVLFTAADLWWNHKFDASAFGQSIGFLLFGGGVGYGLKRVGEKYGSSTTDS